MADTLQDRLDLPTTRKVILLKIVVGEHLYHWTVDGTYTNTYYTATSDWVDGCLENGEAMTEAASVAALDVVDTSARGQFYWDRTAARVYVKPLASLSKPEEATYSARVAFHVSEHGKEYDGVYYEPRLVGTPNVRQHVSEHFDEVGHIGGGTFKLVNADGYFDDRAHLDWSMSEVSMLLGADRMV
jgi:hypothetical protein